MDIRFIALLSSNVIYSISSYKQPKVVHSPLLQTDGRASALSLLSFADPANSCDLHNVMYPATYGRPFNTSTLKNLI